MSKLYRYKDKTYCEDLIESDLDFYDLFNELESDGLVDKETTYYCGCEYYNNIIDLIKDNLEELKIEECKSE